ncbi:hypothetical protein Anapl_00295 [Anas platyrhynchos]|uniref:Uncharacterized protein n=1 Tax=Anas platyrhynchos TaxID=8839 RepID=R0KDI5_ANAPL|nr:hypothetical protein Anapl_00295 [Anas platyrhynchos]
MSTKAKQKQWFLQKTFMPIFLTVHYVTMYITGFGWSTSDLLLPTCVGKETEAAITPKVPPNQLPTTTISEQKVRRVSRSRSEIQSLDILEFYCPRLATSLLPKKSDVLATVRERAGAAQTGDEHLPSMLWAEGGGGREKHSPDLRSFQVTFKKIKPQVLSPCTDSPTSATLTCAKIPQTIPEGKFCQCAANARLTGRQLLRASQGEKTCQVQYIHSGEIGRTLYERVPSSCPTCTNTNRTSGPACCYGAWYTIVWEPPLVLSSQLALWDGWLYMNRQAQPQRALCVFTQTPLMTEQHFTPCRYRANSTTHLFFTACQTLSKGEFPHQRRPRNVSKPVTVPGLWERKRMREQQGSWRTHTVTVVAQGSLLSRGTEVTSPQLSHGVGLPGWGCPCGSRAAAGPGQPWAAHASARPRLQGPSEPLVAINKPLCKKPEVPMWGYVLDKPLNTLLMCLCPQKMRGDTLHKAGSLLYSTARKLKENPVPYDMKDPSGKTVVLYAKLLQNVLSSLSRPFSEPDFCRSYPLMRQRQEEFIWFNTGKQEYLDLVIAYVLAPFFPLILLYKR